VCDFIVMTFEMKITSKHDIKYVLTLA